MIAPILLRALLAGLLAIAPGEARAVGLLRSIWSCEVPCGTADGKKLFHGISVTYCATSVLSQKMISELSPACQERNGRSDIVALRQTDGAVAKCESSANSCDADGLVAAGYECSVLCPTEDKVVHRFTACATTSTQAFSFAGQLCQDAQAPPPNFTAAWDNCVPNGQTGCQ